MTNGEVHICPMCQEEFESEEALQEHGDEEHQDHDPENESGPEGTGLWIDSSVLDNRMCR